jgi:hypothetical protein
MAKENLYFQKNRSLRQIGFKEKSWERLQSNTLEAKSIMAILKISGDMEKDICSLMMVVSTKANSMKAN